MTGFPTNIRPRWGHFIRSTYRFHTEQLASPTFNCTRSKVSVSSGLTLYWPRADNRGYELHDERGPIVGAAIKR
jgi:hypothetical protein